MRNSDPGNWSAEFSRLSSKSPDDRSCAGLIVWARASGCSALDAEVLLANALSKPRSFLLAAGPDPCPAAVCAVFADAVARRNLGEPVAYITGEREFWSLPLRVNPDVLIPRPETELLVETALALNVPIQAQVVDLGTGSGAIALALATERPRWRVTATDASPAALEVARANAERLAADSRPWLRSIAWLRGHWFEPLGAVRLDLIVSNPPYIAPGDSALSAPALQCEPQHALVSAPDGLADLRQIVAAARGYLHPGGALLLEHGSTQAIDVAKMLELSGFAHVVCHADLAGLPRVTEARNPES
jgi:release factor glutamine methyltransferase